MATDTSSTSRRWRVVLDDSRCQGHNRCYSLAPDLFDVDDFGQGMVRSNPTGDPAVLKEKALLAAANCPELAIQVMDLEDPAS